MESTATSFPNTPYTYSRTVLYACIYTRGAPEGISSRVLYVVVVQYYTSSAQCPPPVVYCTRSSSWGCWSRRVQLQWYYKFQSRVRVVSRRAQRIDRRTIKADILRRPLSPSSQVRPTLPPITTIPLSSRKTLSMGTPHHPTLWMFIDSVMQRRGSPSPPPAAQLSGGVRRGGSSPPSATASGCKGSGSRSGARPSRLSREEVAVLSSPRPRRSRPTAGDDADGSFVGSKHRDVRRAYPAKRKQRAATSSSSSSSSPPTATERLRNRGRLVPSNRVDKKMRRFVGTVNKFDALRHDTDSHDGDDGDDDVALGAGPLEAGDIAAARTTPSPPPSHAFSKAPGARSLETRARSPTLSPTASPYTPVCSRVSRSPVRGPATAPAGVRHQGFPTQWPTPSESSPRSHSSGGGRGGAGAGAGGGRGGAGAGAGGGAQEPGGGGARRVVYPWNAPVPQAFPLARCSICGAVALRYSFCCSRILCGTCGCPCDPPAVVVLPPPEFFGSVYLLVIHQPVSGFPSPPMIFTAAWSQVDVWTHWITYAFCPASRLVDGSHLVPAKFYSMRIQNRWISSMHVFDGYLPRSMIRG